MKKTKLHCSEVLFRMTVSAGEEIEGGINLMPDDTKNTTESHSSFSHRKFDQLSSRSSNYSNKNMHISNIDIQKEPDPLTSQHLFEWWLLLLDQSEYLLNVIKLMFENTEMKESTELLLGFIYDGIPSLGIKYGVEEKAQEIVDKRFEEIEERYPGILEDR